MSNDDATFVTTPTVLLRVCGDVDFGTSSEQMDNPINVFHVFDFQRTLHSFYIHYIKWVLSRSSVLTEPWLRMYVDKSDLTTTTSCFHGILQMPEILGLAHDGHNKNIFLRNDVKMATSAQVASPISELSPVSAHLSY